MVQPVDAKLVGIVNADALSCMKDLYSSEAAAHDRLSFCQKAGIETNETVCRK